MLIIESKNEKELEVILSNMKGCKIIKQEPEVNEGSPMPEIIAGTCSACPHFTTRRSSYNRDKFVRWGTCEKLNANVNEHRKSCSLYQGDREEVVIEEQEIKRIYVA